MFNIIAVKYMNIKCRMQRLDFSLTTLKTIIIIKTLSTHSQHCGVKLCIHVILYIPLLQKLIILIRKSFLLKHIDKIIIIIRTQVKTDGGKK